MNPRGSGGRLRRGSASAAVATSGPQAPGRGLIRVRQRPFEADKRQPSSTPSPAACAMKCQRDLESVRVSMRAPCLMAPLDQNSATGPVLVRAHRSKTSSERSRGRGCYNRLDLREPRKAGSPSLQGWEASHHQRVMSVRPRSNWEKLGASTSPREAPRLCGGGSSSLTFQGVHRRNSES